MGNEKMGLVASVDAKLDAIGDKLKKKEWKVPTEIKKKELVNGRAFPNLLMYVMIACSIILIVQQVIKLARRQEVKLTTVNLLVEVKALLIFLAMIVFYFVAKTSGNFAVGSAVFGVLMLFIFRCKKPLYYAVVIAAAVAIWAVFRFGLGVLF